MNLTVGNRKIKVHSVIQGEKPLRMGMMETLEILTDQVPTPSEIKALTEHVIKADDNREFTGYSEVNSVSILLYKPNDVTRMREEEARNMEAMRAMAADLPDELAKKYIEHIPNMRYDGKVIEKGKRINWNGELLKARERLLDVAEFAPNVHPEFWEEV